MISIIIALIALAVVHVHGHGQMIEPKSRNYRAFKDVDWNDCLVDGSGCRNPSVPKKDYCPHCMNNNGLTVVSQCGASQNGGTPNYDFPPAWDGQALTWKSQAVYQQGSIITIKIGIASYHMGFFEFYACPRNQPNTQDCFNQYPLTFVQDNLYGAVKDNSFPMRAYASPLAPSISAETYSMYYEFLMKLPSGLSGDVLIQWVYYTANSCNPTGYTLYPFPWPNGYNNLGACGSPSSTTGERFYNCAEVTLTGVNSSLSPVTSPSNLSSRPSRKPSVRNSRLPSKRVSRKPSNKPVGSQSATWIARCNNLELSFDRTRKQALLHLNTTIGFLQVGQGTISFDDGVVLRAPLNGNSISFNGLALTEVELDSSKNNVNVLYRSPTNGAVSTGIFCTTVISRVLTSTRPTSKSTRSPSRKMTKSPTRKLTKRPTRKPTKRPTRKPTKRPTRKPTTRRLTGKPTKRPTRKPTTRRLTGKPTKRPTRNTLKVPTVSPAARPQLSVSPQNTYITPDRASELVTLPEPPKPIIVTSSNRTNCPHTSGILADWHTSSIWGSSGVPVAGQNATLPSNTRVLISRTIYGTLGFITVPSTSELIIGENAQGIEINAYGFDVQGRLTAGSETCRIETPITITLYGTRSSDITTNARPPMFKGISVSGSSGRLDLHGKRYYRTWTRLAQKANKGDNYVVLQHSINWEYGQAFVLVTTAIKDTREFHQNEVCYVQSVIHGGSSGFGAIVYLQSPVKFTHYANKGYQAEVGLLSRMILIQGSVNDSEPTDSDPLTCTESRWKWGDYGTHCANTELTGFGGHVMVHNGAKGYVEGVQLYRMGQTNVLGRYPFHFHLLGNSCQGCYLKDSSFYRSFYRCISIHGTHNLTVTENVGYDVTGYCYYLEDGVEEDNTLSFNLAAHIHYLGTAPWGDGQQTSLNVASPTLTLPADVAASGFYITNVHNNIIGNAASGGWAGFAFPLLIRPIGLHRSVVMRPSSRTALIIDGNTAHSTGWFWYHSSAFYFGGSLYFNSNNVLTYNAGRDLSFYYGERRTCNIDLCLTSGGCDGWCSSADQAWIRVTNSKVFLVPSVGLNSWSGRMEIDGYEAHDVGLSMELLESGVWINNSLVECRSGETWLMPSNCQATYIKGDGFFWYDVGQKHIMTSATFRNCGYKSDIFNQYDTSPDRGCDDSPLTGCASSSTTFGFLTHSDQFAPEVMQATRSISFQKCGRRFYLRDYRGDNLASTVSGRTQNWHDVDGSISGFQEPTLIGSGQSAAGRWWRVDSQVLYDPQGPLTFIKKNNGPRRSLGHIQLSFDPVLHGQVGKGACGNGDNTPCSIVGYINHFGPMFANDTGLPVTANPSITGPIGGFGWLLKLSNGAPRVLTLTNFEIPPESPLIFGLFYPKGASVTVTAFSDWCYASDSPYYTCSQVFTAVSSHDQVRTSSGNTYHLDSDGFLTIRLISSPQTFTGNPQWIYPKWDTVGKWGSWYALDRFSRGNITLPRFWWAPNLKIEIRSNCNASSQNSAYCSTAPSPVNLVVCPSGYTQVAYDTCCSTVNATCNYASG